MENLKQKNENGIIISWERFGELCNDLAVKIGAYYQPDLIIGIVKAGVIPGVVIASYFKKDFYTIKLSRRSNERVVHARPILFVPVTDSVYGKKVLIVDEISVTGETIRLAKEEVLGKQAEEVRTATLFTMKNGFKPDWHALESDRTIINPWDAD